MKTWKITFDFSDGTKKTFLMAGNDVDALILKLKETYSKYKAIGYQRVEAA